MILYYEYVVLSNPAKIVSFCFIIYRWYAINGNYKTITKAKYKNIIKINIYHFYRIPLACNFHHIFNVILSCVNLLIAL